jgi:sarcosine oxidase, subunit beta
VDTTLPSAADVVVVGGGIIGAAIAYHLASARVGSVTLCEQGRPAGEGSTTRSAGLLRCHHTSHPLTRLAVRSLPAFRHWRGTVGGDCGYREVGFLMLVGPDHTGTLAVNARAVEECGGTSQVLGRDDLAALVPGVSLAGVGAAAYEPSGGYADPQFAARSLVVAARQLGVRVREGVRVTKLLTSGDRVTGVVTNVGKLPAGTVVLANGAWAGKVGRTVGVSLPVTARRIGLALVGTPARTRHRPPAALLAPLPACIDDTIGCYFRSDDAGLYFGVPSHPEVRLGRDVTPLRGGELSAARAAITTRIPALRGAPVLATRAGFDGYTPDRQPVIGWPGPEGLYVAAGMSGGGFKISPAVGELAAGEVAGGARHHLLDPFRPDRFTAGHPLDSDHRYVYS